MWRPDRGAKKSLKRRLTQWVLLPTLVISAIDLLFAYYGANAVATLVQQQLLKGSAKIISEQLATIDGGYEISIPPAAFELFASSFQDRIFYSVHSKSGLLIAGDGELPQYARALQVEQGSYFLTTIRGEPVRVIAYKHALPSTASSDYAITQVAQTLHGFDAFRHDLLRAAVTEHLFLFAILVTGLAFAFRWTLNPLTELGAQLRNRRAGSLERLDATAAPAELRPIIDAMNGYVVRLDQTLSAYEQFVANTAHHLRTTFAILTSQINFGRRGAAIDPTSREVLEALQKSVAQGGKVINQLLVLATVEQKRHHACADSAVNAADVITSVIEELAPLAQQRDIELGVGTIDQSIQIHATQYLLREVVANLVDNAIQHQPPSGRVTLSVARAESTAVLTVTDTGPGIPYHQRLRVFERFYRIDQSRPNSSGLGLAIVAEICQALGATAALSDGEDGIGLRVIVVFPMFAHSSAPAKVSA